VEQYGSRQSTVLLLDEPGTLETISATGSVLLSVKAEADV